jgi:hypothetical protein
MPATRISGGVVGNVFGNVLTWVLGVTGAAVMGYLGLTGSQLAIGGLFGLVTFILIFVASLVIRAPRLIALLQPPKVTPENIEGLIRKWLDEFGLSVRTERSQEQNYFHLQTTPVNGHQIDIVRMKDRSRYVFLRAGVITSGEHAQQITALAPDEKMRLVLAISLELARLGLTYNVDFDSPTQQVVTFARMVPITDALTEDVFIERVDQVSLATTFVLQTIRLRLPQPVK